MTHDQVKRLGKEDTEIEHNVRLEKARRKVRNWQRWGLYFIIFGFVTAFITWQRIFALIFGLPPGTSELNIFWLASGIIEIAAGFTLRIMGAQYERKISKGEIPRWVGC